MKLLVALGNPGPNYNFTRHNFGFLALDFYFKTHGFSWEPHEKFHSIYAKQGTTLFLKPTTFYNDSGLAVRAAVDFYKIPLEDVLVLCDDFSLPFGELRFRAKGSAGGNNGLKSIISTLGTPDFPRLRLGTNNPALREKLDDTSFVLGHFTPEEKAVLPAILRSVEEKIDEFLTQ